ncbi:MAG: histidine phosphatase family protein [Sporolactobacillus sp.]
MKTLYLVRHGETLLNLLNRSQGWADSPLTEKGAEQASKLGRALKKNGISFDAAYTSDAGRARETAKLVLLGAESQTVPLIETTDLREVAFGSFEGVDNDQMWEAAGTAVGESGMSRKSPIERKLKALSGIKQLDTIHYAESAVQINTRIDHFIKQIVQTEANHLLLVSHSLMICCILHHLIPEGLRIDRVPNASVTKIRLEQQHYLLDYIGRTDQF